jgi:hypothetical protein
MRNADKSNAPKIAMKNNINCDALTQFISGGARGRWPQGVPSARATHSLACRLLRRRVFVQTAAMTAPAWAGQPLERPPRLAPTSSLCLSRPGRLPKIQQPPRRSVREDQKASHRKGHCTTRLSQPLISPRLIKKSAAFLTYIYIYKERERESTRAREREAALRRY